MSLIALQKKIGVTADGAFGPGTLKAAAAYFKLNKNRAAHFFAQTGHETGDFKVFTENLNYSKDGLMKIFKKYFPTEANRVYASRMGNGPEASGEGYKYRGRGAIQLTGQDNYEAFAAYCKRPDVLTNPDIVATELSFESALWFFERNHLWAICDQGTTDAVILQITKRVNGGTHGLPDRQGKTHKYAGWL